MTDSTPSRRELAASAQIRNKPIVKAVSGLLAFVLGTAVGATVWALTNVAGLDTPSWVIPIVGVVMLAWYFVSIRTRKEGAGGGVATKLEDTVLSGASKVVDPAKAMAALLEGTSPAPGMAKAMLRKAGHMVTPLPQEGVELEMVVTRNQQAALLVGVTLNGTTPQDCEPVQRLSTLCRELADNGWELSALAVASDFKGKNPVKVGSVVVCSAAQVSKALVFIPKIAR